LQTFQAFKKKFGGEIKFLFWRSKIFQKIESCLVSQKYRIWQLPAISNTLLGYLKHRAAVKNVGH
jgi:hypothetical protein